MPDFSFRLLPDFIEKYKTQEPPFGFRDAGGNSLGELTFLRTYSNLNTDGTKERWTDTCVRVTNGTYSIQKSHAKNNKLEWNDQKGQSSAKEFFDRMFNLKWTPPGRGLEKMGSKQVMDGNSASLQNCFSYDTEFVTKQGIRSLGEMSGQSVEVWANGDWVKAKVQEFGSQPIQEIHFVPFGSKTNHKVIVKATPNHRWELRNGEVTDHLSENDVVSSSVVVSYDFNSEGFRHGLIFADGSINHTYANGDFGHMMRLCGKKERWKFLFDNIQYQPNCEGDPVVYLRSETNMKSLPKTKDASYLASFIRGWLEFDGHSEGPSYVLDTQNAEASAWLEKNCIYAGFVTIGKSVDSSPTNFGERSFPLNRIRLSSKPDRMWKVVKINPLPEEEPVYCAVVPGVERFTLAGGIYTGNCAVISTGDIDRHDPGAVFQWAMLALMYGVGVGADMLGAKKNIEIRERVGDAETFIVPDSREGWAESLRLLINSYLRHNAPVIFDYSLIRPKGTPLKTFGGLASGPDPLIMLHDRLNAIFEKRVGRTLDSETIVDIFNMIGACVIAGSTRRSAEIMLGDYDDSSFLDLKNSSVYPERNSYDPENPGWAWASNNSINVPVGADYEKYLDLIVNNGEPGFVWLDVAKSRGRMMDSPDDKDRRVVAMNPCCLSPDTTIMTTKGPQKISEIGSEFVAVVDGNEYAASKPWVSGIGDVYTLKTKEGFKISLTKEHKVLLDSGEWKQAQELDSGDKICLVKKSSEDKREYCSFQSLEFEHTGEVWDAEVSDVHAFDANGIYAHNSEQPLESQEMCVSGDTIIQLRDGAAPIQSLVGQSVDVWNGESWSTVTPFETGSSKLVRVWLSDGTYLDATPKHKWSVRASAHSPKNGFIEKTTDSLSVGDKLEQFSLGEIDGKPFDYGYEYGWVAGDGYIDNGKVMAVVQEPEYGVLDTMTYKSVYKEQHPEGYKTPYSRINFGGVVNYNHAVELRNDKIPDEIFSWDATAIAEFIAGWIDTDGSLSKQANTDNYVLYGSEQKMRAAILLLRRIGVNSASLHLFGKKGDVTNFGTRNQDLFRIHIPTHEAALIPTRLKRAKRFGRGMRMHPTADVYISSVPIQKVVKIEELDGIHETYCFTEPVHGKGVFGNVLTHQCTLVTVHLQNAESKEDFLRTLKFAFLYAKTVTLVPTPWTKTNSVMQRNRRIGLSLTGITDVIDERGLPEILEWMEAGYEEVRRLDKIYSEWLCVRESNRVTTIKPEGTVSLLSGASPGIHWGPGGKYYMRAIRFGGSDNMIPLFRAAGYKVEKDLVSHDTYVVYFPVKSNAHRSEREVSVFEKIGLAAKAQHYWSDNGVSVTVSFDKETERHLLVPALRLHEGSLKAVSFLPMSNEAYPQQPYTQITKDEYNSYVGSIKKIDFSAIYDGVDNLEAIGDRYCSNDTCSI